jgi:hypothetical protein
VLVEIENNLNVNIFVLIEMHGYLFLLDEENVLFVGEEKGHLGFVFLYHPKFLNRTK